MTGESRAQLTGRERDTLAAARAEGTRMQSLGGKPYGLMHLMLNALRARGLGVAKEKSTVIALKALLGERRSDAYRSSLRELDASQHPSTVNRVVKATAGIVAEYFDREHRVRVRPELLAKSALRFLANRYAMRRLMTTLEEQARDYHHGVIYWRGKGTMPNDVLAEVMVTLRKVSRVHDIAYMVDVSERGVHFHYLCGEDTGAVLRERVGSLAGVQVSPTPAAAVAYWRENSGPRDVQTYLALKLTPSLQPSWVSARVRDHCGSLDHDVIDFGKVTTHVKRHAA